MNLPDETTERMERRHQPVEGYNWILLWVSLAMIAYLYFCFFVGGDAGAHPVHH